MHIASEVKTLGPAANSIEKPSTEKVCVAKQIIKK